jgi:hypothetical protein
MNTVAQRAAHYFGWQDVEHDPIKVGQHKCVLVGERAGETQMVIYSEEFKPTGMLLRLSNLRREQLSEALSAFGVDERAYHASRKSVREGSR